ncbi:MAG: CinA family protein [Proteobacteria bacterium]|nr:CinA family protein [Pseudomonadota bacterium]
MEPLMQHAGRVAVELKARGQTIAVGESAAGGLITAALLAVPGASAYCRGGLVIYTRNALLSLKAVDLARLATMRASTEAYACFEAHTLRTHFETDWGLGETGAAGPTGNKYGDAAGHACVAVAGPGLGLATGAIGERSRTLETGSTDRLGNMQAFAAAALLLMAETLEGLPAAG